MLLVAATTRLDRRLPLPRLAEAAVLFCGLTILTLLLAAITNERDEAQEALHRATRPSRGLTSS